MTTRSGKFRTTIRLTVVSVFILATVVTAVVAIGLQYFFSESMARDSASELYSATAASVASELGGIARVNTNVIDLLADNPDLADPEREEALVKIFAQVLEKNPLLYGVYVGRADGSLLEVINLNASEAAKNRILALAPDRWLVMSVGFVDGERTRRYRYLDKHLRERVSRSELTDYDPTARPWYQSAYASGRVEVSKPYLFAQLGAPGRTVSKRVSGADTVVGMDMTLFTLSRFLAEQQISATSEIFLHDQDGMVIASNVGHGQQKNELPVPEVPLTAQERAYLDSLGTLRVSNELDWPPFDYAQQGEPRGYSIDVIRIITAALDIPVEFVNGYTWSELAQSFRDGDIDLLHPVALTGLNRDWGLSGESFAALPFALVTRDDSPAPGGIADLRGRTLTIPSGWSIIPLLRSAWPDLEILESTSTLNALEMVGAGEADAALDYGAVVRYIASRYFISGLAFHSDIDLGLAQVPDKLHIFSAANKPQLRALLDRAISALGEEQLAYLKNAWLADPQESSGMNVETVPSSRLLQAVTDPSLQGELLGDKWNGEDYLLFSKAIVTATDSGREALYVGIVTPRSDVMGPFLEQVFLSVKVTSVILLLLLPLSWFFATPIVRPVRQLAAENDKVRRLQFDAVNRVNSHVRELDELSESMVDMVASIKAHEKAQRDLMDAIIRLIAQAIDDKSAYTGGHCERVPELALMLAGAATGSDDPAFRDFRLDDEDQWREYRIAAWLHDCGKITMPEHIVDKGSKLETIYNRIHEVRMRFEVLSRDAEVHYWEQLAEHPERAQVLREELAEGQRQLQDDFEFVAECNVGGEFLDEGKQERLLHIAQTTWQRRFSDRSGLSPVEELRQRGEAAPLPATERLLADKHEHIIERTASTDYDPGLGINMDVPEHLYNQGEIYNLSVSRGTLTTEDRFKINEHMISTIKMLDGLPFPEELKNVPRYASTHHETMRGSGYPRKLPGDQLSIPERILAVADVFEALTASDRPYKKAKPVSAAVEILHKMVEDNHIDRDCFELFIREEVYLQYAQQFLEPAQVDDIDVSRYLS